MEHLNRKLGMAIILNVLNLLDLALTLIATQLPHIDFMTTETNLLFMNAYAKLLAGNWIPMFLLILIKILLVFVYSLCLIRFGRCYLFTISFGVIFSCYTTALIGWLLLIVWAYDLNPFLIDLILGLLFALSFGICYSLTELKERFTLLITHVLKKHT